MLEQIRKKMDIEPLCDLSIEELKVLYGIDSELNSDKINYIKKRDNYEDFIKIFGSDRVAQKVEEIDENTIAYIGFLYINRKMPTYNLRYVYGDLSYELSNAYNLENLQYIIGKAYFELLTSAEGLENLQYISLNADFGSLKNSEDLASFEYIGGCANFKSLKAIEGLRNLKYICGIDISDIVSDVKDLPAFFKEHVACNPSQITENTIIYIGDLVIDLILPTNNLKYICGTLTYKLSEVHNLENLLVMSHISAIPEIKEEIIEMYKVKIKK